MKSKTIIFIVLISLVIGVIGWYNGISLSAREEYIQITKDVLMELYNKQGKIKLNFYHWDRETNQKQEFIGTAELKRGKLTYDVKDKRLEKMLKGNFHTMITVKKDGKPIDKFVTYKVGTIEHIMSVIDHLKDISCMAEVVK